MLVLAEMVKLVVQEPESEQVDIKVAKKTWIIVDNRHRKKNKEK